jgi:hypothetical protein
MPKQRGFLKHVRNTLPALGFNHNRGSIFTREVGMQIHFVQLQHAQHVTGFTFNLGCHFVDVPSMFDFQPVSVDDLDVLDCGLSARIGTFIGNGLDVWWDPCEHEVPAVLAQVSWRIERVFGDCISDWGNGTRLLQRQVKASERGLRLSRQLRRWEPTAEFTLYSFLSILAQRRRMRRLSDLLCAKALRLTDFPSRRQSLLLTLGKPDPPECLG